MAWGGAVGRGRVSRELPAGGAENPAPREPLVHSRGLKHTSRSPGRRKCDSSSEMEEAGVSWIYGRSSHGTIFVNSWL